MPVGFWNSNGIRQQEEGMEAVRILPSSFVIPYFGVVLFSSSFCSPTAVQQKALWLDDFLWMPTNFLYYPLFRKGFVPHVNFGSPSWNFRVLFFARGGRERFFVIIPHFPCVLFSSVSPGFLKTELHSSWLYYRQKLIISLANRLLNTVFRGIIIS